MMTAKHTRCLALLIATLVLFSAPRQLYAEPNAPLPAPRSSENSEKKLEQARKFYELFPLNEGLKRSLAEGYAAYGHILFKQKQYEQADENLVKAVELYPDEPVYALLRGICQYTMKKYDVARYELERVRSLQPESVEGLIYLGLVLYDTDSRLDAVQLWEQALILAPKRGDIVQLLEKARKEAAVEDKMDRGNSSRFNLTYDPGVPASFAIAVLDVLESASNQVGAELGHFPEGRVPVVIYKRDDYKSVTNSPDWSGGVYDGTIRLPFGAMSEINAGLRSVLFHEYAHVVVYDLTRGNCPIWLNEGIAEMFGRKQLEDARMMHTQAAGKGPAVDIRKLEGSFTSLSTAEASIAYQQSYSMVKYVVTAYGWHRIQQILSELGRGASINDAIASTLKSYNLSYDGLVNEWQDAMMREGSGR
jgi:tetratricopeptide (TPR) repeat protein